MTTTTNQPTFPKSLNQLLTDLLKTDDPSNNPSPKRPKHTPTQLLPQSDLNQHPLIAISLNRILNQNIRQLLSQQQREVNEIITSSLEQLDQLDNYVFDRLNTGHWKSVDGLWRRVYSAVCLLKVILQLLSSPQQHDNTTLEAIKTCDMSILMGHPIHDNILSKTAEELCLNNKTTGKVPTEQTPKQPTRSLRNKSTREFRIQQLTKPSLEQFSSLMAEGTPAKLLGIVDHWPAVRLWDVEYIREVAGHRSTPVELGQRYTSSDWTQRIMTINEFIDKYIYETGTVGYIAQHDLFSQIPSLGRDIIVPDYVQLSKKEPEINAWFGPSTTISPTHHDPYHNILIQVFGTKLIRLFPPSETVKLKPYPEGSLLFNTSSLDVEEDDGLDGVAHCDLVLGRGEAVFIPRGWWHYVRGVGDGGGGGASFSVSFWFD